MSSHTRKMKPVDVVDRWLYRKDGNDYGPITTDELMNAMVEKKVDLQTQVFSLQTRRWQTAAEHQLLRDFYGKCTDRWAAQALDHEADKQVKRLARARKAKHGLWRVLLIGFIVAVAIGAYVVWRLGQATPIGVASLVRDPKLPRLPVPQVVVAAMDGPPILRGTAVDRLSEPETYDTAGVKQEGDVDTTPAVAKMQFGEDGELVGGGAGIAKADLDRVIASARGGLHGCATSAAKRDRSFGGTEVGFTVRPGKLTDITVGNEVKSNAPFKACVKAALAAVSVPAFSGSTRRVTLPLKVSW
ncbi:MAG: hypothetical protein H6745_27030 [Deltaproteobacteria bacterium]|nr:hypothetical protein [Deltaproteobacteria bacterium]